MTAVWHNWARNVTADPLRVLRPRHAQEIAEAVTAAARDGLTVKAIGAGHSFTGIAAAPGVQLDLQDMQGVLGVDPAQRRVRFAAGTRLHQVPRMLKEFGLAMENLGDIDAQSLAGATSTGTHGTGARFGGMATQIAALKLVDGQGVLREISPQHQGELFDAARLGLGALGVITELTIQCVPRFKLHAVESPEPLHDLLADFDRRATEADHFEFYWFPHTTTALTKTNTRLPLDAPSRPLGAVRRWLDDDVLANRIFGLMCALGKAAPGLIPPVNRLAQQLAGNRDYTDVSTSVFTTLRKVRFREMEYALPRETIPAVVREIDRLIESRRWRISFPLEVRVAAPDGIWLSTAHGRDTGYVAVHRYFKEDHHEYFRAVEEIFRAHGGRPHWGKIHYQEAGGLARLYPRFGDFLAARDKLDPHRIFANPYLERVLSR